MTTTNEKQHINLSLLHDDVYGLVKNLKVFSLENGMQVVFFKDTTKPKVLLELAYNVGASIEQSFEKGLAHLVEHMIFKGTSRLSESDIDAIGRKYGASYNAYTSNDVTAYHFEVIKDSWLYFLEILADTMQNSRFESEHLASELKAVVQELNLLKDDAVDKVLEKACTILFPANHPYHFPVIGFKEELARLNVEELKTFYNKYYHPSKAALFMVGDFSFEEAEVEVRRNFGSIKNPKDSYEPLFPPIIPSLNNISYLLYDDVEQEKIFYFWTLPGLDVIDTALVDVLYEILAGGQNNRLYKVLVDDLQLAEAVDLNFILLYKASIVMLSVVPKEEDSQRIKDAINKEFEKILHHGFNATETSRVKMGLALSFVRKTESWHGLVSDWCNELFLQGHPTRTFEYIKNLDKVSTSTLNDFFSKYFSLGCTVEIQVKPLVDKKQKLLWSQAQEIISQQEDLILENHQRTLPLEEPRFVNSLPQPKFFDYEFPRPTVQKKLNSGIDFFGYFKENYPVCFFKLNFKNSHWLSKSKEGLLVDLMMQLLLEKNLSYEKYDSLDFLDSLGAHYGFDYEGISLTCLSVTYKKALDRILKIFCEPQFEEDLIERQKSILIADLKERSENPQKIAFKLFYQSLFEGDSDYDFSFESAIKFVEKISLDDLQTCHKKYLNPNSFSVCIAGADLADETCFLLEKYFDQIKAQDFIVKAPSFNTSILEKRVSLFRDQVTILLGKISTVELGHQDYLPLSILNIVLFYSLGSRVYELRERQGLFYSVFGGFALDADQFMSLDYVCTAVNPAKVDYTISEFYRILNEVAKDGITNDELESAKQLYLGSLLNLFSDVNAASQVMLALSQKQQSFDFYDKALVRLKSLTKEDINNVAKKYLNNISYSSFIIGKV